MLTGCFYFKITFTTLIICADMFVVMGFVQPDYYVVLLSLHQVSCEILTKPVDKEMCLQQVVRKPKMYQAHD